ASRTSHVELHAVSTLFDGALAFALWTNAWLLDHAVAVTVATHVLPRNVQPHHAAANCRPKGNVDLIFDIGAWLRAFWRGAAASTSENSGEDVAKSASTRSRAVACAFEHVTEIESTEVERNALTLSRSPLCSGKSAEAACTSRAAPRVSFGGRGIDVVG